MSPQPLSSNGWPLKAAAGLILGLLIALAISGLFAWFGPGGLTGGTGKTQFNMWMIAPIWALILSLVFLFSTAKAAWGWLGLVLLALISLNALGRLLMETAS